MSDQPARDADRQWDQTRSWESPEPSGSVPDTLSAQEAAQLLGIHERTVRRAIGSGELAALKQGGSFHIRGKNLERYRQAPYLTLMRENALRLPASRGPHRTALGRAHRLTPAVHAE